jgi:hypothetical protein
MLQHSGHCRLCKERVRELLTVIYGDCRVNYSFPWPANPTDYKNTAIGEVLHRISTALGELRGNRNFIKSAQVPPCDYYLADAAFILEFDESQHFSPVRLASLSLYPPDFKAGFPISRWKELCRVIDACDDEPPDRDERRAWYDSLRDFVPTVHGFDPTARLYADEYPWCSLDSRSTKDQQTFSSILKERLPGAVHCQG